jgi:hypothetical protein
MRQFFSYTYLLTIGRLGSPNPDMAINSRCMNNLSMSILNFDGPSGRNFGKPFRVILGIGALAAVVAVASTLAANININSGPVEFGQGVAQTTACSGDNAITVTPHSSFVNSESSTSFSFTGVSISDIPEECLGVDFKISAYGESGDAIRLIGACAYMGTEPVVRFTGEESYQTSASAVDMDLNLLNPSETSFTIDWTGFVNGYDEPCPLADAEDVYKITVETSEQINYVLLPWSSVTWGESDQSGPLIYANSLTSGKPSWLEEVTTGGNLEYSFTSNGMGILGEANGLTFPYVSSFTIPHNEKVKIEFVFSYYSECEDQGVILFSESATPIWGWGQTDNGLIAQWNCSYPVLGWSTGDTEPDIDGQWPSILEIGAPYLGILEYDPNLPSSNLKLTTKTYSGEVIDSVVVSGELLPTGEDYKIGFSADQDDAEGVSYFKNLKITIG